MNRDLVIGMVFALLLHSGLVWWGSQQARPRPATLVKQETVRTVREQIELPKPPAPPPPLPPPEPKPEPEAAQPAQAAAPPRTPVAKPRAARPEAAPKPAEAQPDNNEPQPLVLSQTYGAGGDTGVAVQTGKEDVLGDPGVEANERNTRRRSDAAPASPQGEAAAVEREAKVEIVHAAPKTRCTVEWPEGAAIGNRVIEVTLSLQIATDGAVTGARILRSAGQPFDGTAVAAMKACAFRPGTRDGKPFVDRIPFVVEFKPSAQ